MPEKISGYVSDEMYEIIEEMRDHHDISEAKAISILLKEGVVAREMRYKLEIMDAKMDMMIESLGGEHGIAEKVGERLTEMKGDRLPETVSETDIEVEPLPEYQSNSEYVPDDISQS